MLYEFVCLNKHHFDKILPVDRRNEDTVCPICDEKAVRNLLATGTSHKWVGPPEWASAWKQGKFV